MSYVGASPPAVDHGPADPPRPGTPKGKKWSLERTATGEWDHRALDRQTI